jgi:hypothetical protein
MERQIDGELGDFLWQRIARILTTIAWFPF